MYRRCNLRGFGYGGGSTPLIRQLPQQVTVEAGEVLLLGDVTIARLQHSLLRLALQGGGGNIQQMNKLSQKRLCTNTHSQKTGREYERLILGVQPNPHP